MTLEDVLTIEGYTYVTIYRNHSVYTKRVDGNYTYAAGDKERVWIFADSFGGIRAQLDEIASKAPA